MPFRKLADLPLAMTAHIVYEDVDPDHCATYSAKVIRDVVRGEIGFDGLLMTDDLSMKALTGGFGERTRLALEAGCDIVLHCNGKMDEMKEVAAASVPLEGAALGRAERATARLAAPPAPIDVAEGTARLARLLDATAA